MVKFKLNKTLRNTLIVLAVIILAFVITSLLPDRGYAEKYAGEDLTVNSSSTVKNYATYLREHSNAKNVQATVSVNVLDYDIDSAEGVRAETNYSGKDVLVTEDRSFVSWKVSVPESGFYNIAVEYIAIPSRNVSMERILYVNGEIPFEGSDALAFHRLWKDGSEVKFDNRGNAIRPSQKEFFEYQTVLLKSDLGYEVDPYRFYFEAGENTISLESTNEPMAISNISLVPVTVYDTYEQYLAKQPGKPSDEKGDYFFKIQGEDATRRSDPSLFARYDRSSATTEPYSVKNTVLNYIGGDSWKDSGQWVEWDFEVPEDGWYTISVKGRQLYQRGSVSCRSVYIDGEIPVDSLKSVGFAYSSDWNLVTLSDDEGTPLDFYLTKGSHKIRLEATLGEIGTLISEIKDCVFRLNEVYRTILVLTGTMPDQYRDYEIEKIYPAEVEQMNRESKILYSFVDRFAEITGQKSTQISPAETLAIQLEKFYKRPEKITQAFANFKDNVTSLGASILQMTESKLDIDYIAIQSSNRKIKKANSNFFKKARHEIVSFVTSFFVDSASLGNVYDANDEHTIQVWITTGRDQSQILKNMIDDTFSPQTGINVNVKLIVIDSLLNAVLAGNGPDIVISTYQSHPVDYALRNANVNLARFPDLNEVLTQFKESSYLPYQYNNGLFALPETETFNLLFYRKDILQQLGVEVPRTWEELIEILPTLQGNNLSVGVPYPNIITPDMSTLYSMIYQKGGTVYNKNGTKSIIDSEEGISSFKTYTGLYNDYGFPTIYDFASRFRTGEMPIGVANYATFNTLTVAAPEIRGLWDFTYILGTEREDGTIDRSNIAGTTCSMMIKKGTDLDDLNLSNKQELINLAFNGGKLPDSMEGVDARTWAGVVKNETRIQDSWTFLKWWTSTETQVRFGRELEAVLGSSARYATANVEALKQLAWKSAQLDILTKSLDETVGVPEVPGSYYTPRHVVNAARKVINDKTDARETLIDYTRLINEEIVRKRQEFNLPVEE
ncbi:MAG: extracellular solute-binding protein [Treponema sp.]|nr:extracellular solute-binding protein [Treponema sp.]